MNKIILLDLDETIIDTKYQFNCSRPLWKQTIKRAGECGVVIGLNSDTPLVTMRRLASEFGLSGPLIAERGAVVLINGVEHCVAASTALEFPRFRLAVISALFPLVNAGRLLIVTGDVNELSNRMPRMIKAACSAELAVLINGFRQYSFSCFVRKRENASWVKDSGVLDEVISVLSKVGRDFRVLWKLRDIDRNPDYGFLGVHLRVTQKCMAVRRLLSEAEGSQVYMIGNSMSDWCGENSRLTHCAVANATDDFKANCAHVAHGELTRGVIELIDKIVES